VPRSQARPSLLRRLNERAILTALQRHGPHSRADLTRLTGISGPTVTRAVATLIDARVLEEDEPQPGGLGRPGKVLRLAREGVGVAGVVVGGRTTEIVQAGLDGAVDERMVISIATGSDYSVWVRDVTAALRRVIDNPDREVFGVGVSLPGLYDARSERTLVSPNVRMTNGQRVGPDLQAALERDVEVTVLQECDALCVAEQAHGAARDVLDFAMVDISEGLGLGVVERGKLLEGHSGLAGELGHITVDLNGRECGCGNRGCLETVATDTVLVERVAERLGTSLTMDEMLARVAARTIDIEAELNDVIAYLGIGLAAAINLFNPARLFVYGRLFDARSDVFARVVAEADRRALRPSRDDCEIIRARGNKRLGAVAAAIHPLTRGRGEPAV
jgi:predicted NBD/HSP70 family sugar kinase